MPIRPENKSRYPKDWKVLSAAIRCRANHCCEFCGVPNHSIVVRPKKEHPYYWEFVPEGMEAEVVCEEWAVNNIKPVKIILTVAHLDHNPENNHSENLRALCQRCHNVYDRKHRNQTRYRTMAGSQELF